MTVEDVARFTARGQYGSGADCREAACRAIEQEPGVDPQLPNGDLRRRADSRLRTGAGPEFLSTSGLGKRLARQSHRDPRASRTERHRPCLPARRRVINPNVITISIQPDEGISIAFDAKRPGPQVRTVTVQANFSYQAQLWLEGAGRVRNSACSTRCAAMQRYLHVAMK